MTAVGKVMIKSKLDFRYDRDFEFAGLLLPGGGWGLEGV